MENKCKKCGQPRTLRKCGKRRRCQECARVYQRSHYAKNLSVIRKRKAKAMAEARRDPRRAKLIRISAKKKYDNGGSERQKARFKKMQNEDPFRWRSYLIRRLNPSITASDLEALWETQGGLCALTGIPMDIRDADIDHILPRSRGGGSELSNLRWVSRIANKSKGNMTDDELLSFCQSVAAWIGRRLVRFG